MDEFLRLRQIIAQLRAENGCPWDREQTHSTLKAACIEEAAEVICGINIYEETGNADNLREELGDLLLQVVMHAQIAEEEGLFTMDDVAKDIADKMVRRHPHVFGDVTVNNSGEVLENWAAIKANEKASKKIKEETYLKPAMEEAKNLIDVAMERKKLK